MILRQSLSCPYPFDGLLHAVDKAFEAAILHLGFTDEIAQQLISSNPQLAKIAAGKTSDQIMSVAENMCRERGTTVDAVLESYGITR